MYLAANEPLVLAESEDVIKMMIDDMPYIDGERAMEMFMFLMPMMKNSMQIREMFTEMLKEAMYQRSESTRRMATYGACLLLKQLKVIKYFSFKKFFGGKLLEFL